MHMLMFVYVCGSNQVFGTLRRPPPPNPTSPAAPKLGGIGGNAGRPFRGGGLRGRLPAHKDRILFWIEQSSEPERGKFYVFMALLCWQSNLRNGLYGRGFITEMFLQKR